MTLAVRVQPIDEILEYHAAHTTHPFQLKQGLLRLRRCIDKLPEELRQIAAWYMIESQVSDWTDWTGEGITESLTIINHRIHGTSK